VRVIVGLTIGLGLVASVLADQKLEFNAYSIPDNGRIIVPVAQGDTFTGVAAIVDQKTNGALTVAAKDAEFVGEVGSTLTLRGVAPEGASGDRHF
jgi:leucyl aminopeptidase